MSDIAILDLGYGNTDSIRLAFERLGAGCALVDRPEQVDAAARLVLPGVGAAPFAMRALDERELLDPIRRRTSPTLGICLGMQLMFDTSEEGNTPCLGLVPGKVRAMRAEPGSPVPHMGWTRLLVEAPTSGIADGDYVYFAHSFVCDDGPAISARADYGGRRIPAALRTANLWGAQFHPERSSEAGARYLKAFLQS